MSGTRQGRAVKQAGCYTDQARHKKPYAV
jgi:hypothetical protein